MNTYYSVKQVAFILKVHSLTIRRYIRDGKLKAIKAGGNVRITESDLQAFHKDVTPPPAPDGIILKPLKKFPAKQFSMDDPFLRLEGRGASLT